MTTISKRTIDGRYVTGYYVESCPISASTKHRKNIVDDLLNEYDGFFVKRGSIDLHYFGFHNHESIIVKK